MQKFPTVYNQNSSNEKDGDGMGLDLPLEESPEDENTRGTEYADGGEEDELQVELSVAKK